MSYIGSVVIDFHCEHAETPTEAMIQLEKLCEEVSETMRDSDMKDKIYSISLGRSVYEYN